jgi:hypothetical protein
MRIKKAVTGVTTIAAALLISSAAQALTVTKTLHPVYPGTISGTTTYSANEVVNYTFTVAAPYHFTFTATGSGGNFPFPIEIEASGTSGTYTEKFGAFPVHGSISYSLTTAVPEPGVWLMLAGGFGLVGASARRRTRAVVA